MMADEWWNNVMASLQIEYYVVWPPFSLLKGCAAWCNRMSIAMHCNGVEGHTLHVVSVIFKSHIAHCIRK